MEFRHSQDVLDLRDGAREYLRARWTAAALRTMLESASDEAPDWKELADMGLTALLVPQACGGLGLDASGFALIAEECGYVALPHPLSDVAGVAVTTLLAAQDSALNGVLEAVASGETRVRVCHWVNPYLNRLSEADRILHIGRDEVHLLEAGAASIRPVRSIDPLRELCEVQVTCRDDTLLADGERARRLSELSLQRGALFCAAQLLGLSAAMIDMSRAYAGERKQFGAPIGTFQAVKHLLADAFVKLEFARPVVYRAAATLDQSPARVDVHVAHAKLAATDAALDAAEAAIQVHGAMGYTFEVDLHLWMKRVWALAGLWGERNYHMKLVDQAVLAGALEPGPAATFATAN